MEPASEALEEEDGSDVMEDAISDVTSSTPGSDRDGSEEPNGSSSKKRVHFADDTDSTAIFRCVAMGDRLVSVRPSVHPSRYSEH